MKSLHRILVLVAALLLTGSIAEARVYIDVTSQFRKIPMAVPYFLNGPQATEAETAGKELAGILTRALTFHGFISVSDPATYGGRQDSDWPALGAEFVILGNYETKGNSMAAEMRLVDVKEGQMIAGRRYSGPLERRRDMMLRFCDEVVLQLTGERGVSQTQIAFISDATGKKEVHLSDVLGDETRQVTRHQSITVSPRFAPDGVRLAYTSYHRENPNLYVTDLRQSKTTKSVSTRAGLNMAPAWSPDGSTMAVTLSKDGNPDLYLIDLDGKILRRLTAEAGINVSPNWSPDGKSLAFTSDRTGTPQVYIMDLGSQAVRRITYEGNYNTSPSWSPKGDMIAYAGLSESKYHIFTIRPDGGKPVQLTQSWGDHESPSWSPDGRQIVFSRKRDGKSELCTVFANGAGMHTLFNLSGNQTNPQWSPRLNQ